MTAVSTNTTCIAISPERTLLDEELDISINGLPPRQRITLVSRVDESGARFYSYAYYISDDAGQVDVKTLPAEDGGCYKGIEPMGLIWSQKQEPGQKRGRRLVKADVTTPIVTHIYVLNDFIIAGDCLQSIKKGQYLAHTLCKRLHVADGVERIEVQDGLMRGTLFIPKGAGPFPGIVDLFGGIGGVVEHRSALLASRGIASFALGYFFNDEKDLERLNISYFEEGIDYLLSHPKVKKPYAGIIGVSKGAEIALLTASLCHKVKACVEINGAYMVTEIPHSYKDEEYPEIHVFLPDAKYDNGAYSMQHIYYSYHDPNRQSCIIPVERGECEYLLIHGTDDQIIAPLAAEYIPKRLKEHNKTNYRVLLYPGAGHLLEPPHSPHFFKTYQGLFQTSLIWGGHPRQHARAQEDAWQQVLRFIKEVLEDKEQKLKPKL